MFHLIHQQRIGYPYQGIQSWYFYAPFHYAHMGGADIHQRGKRILG